MWEPQLTAKYLTTRNLPHAIAMKDPIFLPTRTATVVVVETENSRHNYPFFLRWNIYFRTRRMKLKVALTQQVSFSERDVHILSLGPTGSWSDQSPCSLVWQTRLLPYYLVQCSPVLHRPFGTLHDSRYLKITRFARTDPIRNWGEL